MGQIIKLAGVKAQVDDNISRIVAGAADAAALRIGSLTQVVSPKSMSPILGGNISGNCRLTGKPLLAKGSVPTAIQLRNESGFVGIGLSSLSSAAVGLPPGSATPSYSIVVAVRPSQTDIDSPNGVNLLTSYTPDGVLYATILRYYGKPYTGQGGSDNFIAAGSSPYNTANLPATIVRRPDVINNGWVIVSIDYDDISRKVSMSLNGGPYSSVIKSTNNAPGTDAYFTIGHATSTDSIRRALVGDLYLCNDSLLKSPIGQKQLSDLVSALKYDYGIA